MLFSSTFKRNREINCFVQASFANLHAVKKWKVIARTGQKKDPDSKDEGAYSCEEGRNAVPHFVLLNQLQKCTSVSHQIDTFCSLVSITEEDIKKRKEFCKSLVEICSIYFTEFKIHEFGSSCNGLGFKGCDVDVSIQTIFDNKDCIKDLKEVPTPESVSEGITSPETLARLPPIFLLRFVRRILRRHCSDIRGPILLIKGRCPILRFYNSKYDLFCDFSYANEASLRNTRLIRLICHLDERFSSLAKFIRYWGKYGGIVGDIDLFSSYAFSLLIVHFLQLTQPPVLLPLKEVIEKSSYLKHSDVNNEALLYEDLKNFEPSKNTQTVEELLKEYFFHFLYFDYSTMMLPLTSSIIPKTSFWASREDGIPDEFEFSTIVIQDPFRPNFNTTMSAMYRCCKKFLNGLLLACKTYQDETLWNPSSEMWGLCSLFHRIDDHQMFKDRQENRSHTVRLPQKTEFSVVKDILEQGLLFECTEVISSSTRYSQPSQNLHCKVYYNAWQGRNWIRRQCPKSLSDPLQIENWISKEVQSKEIFKCDKCGRVFTAEQALKNHSLRHRPEGSEKRHSCNLCPYSTNYSSHLRQHMFTHSGERPFKCTHCDAGFTQNSVLRKHMLTHKPKKDEEKVKCERCFRKFENEKQLTKHMKIHKNKEKPHKCGICFKRFRKQSNLEKHEKKHKKNSEDDKTREPCLFSVYLVMEAYLSFELRGQLVLELIYSVV